MKNIKAAFSVSLIFFLSTLSSFAQSAGDQVEMADAMHTNGKIYVVVAVLSVVFIGIVVFLISIDRKVAKLEKKLREKQ